MEIAPPRNSSLPTAAAGNELGMLKVGRTVVDIYRGEAYGRRDGYRSLESAISAVSQLSSGSGRGVAITEEGGRYFGYAVTAAVADARYATGLKVGDLHLSRFDDAHITPLHRHNDLAAVVDGSVVLRNS